MLFFPKLPHPHLAWENPSQETVISNWWQINKQFSAINVLDIQVIHNDNADLEHFTMKR